MLSAFTNYYNNCISEITQHTNLCGFRYYAGGLWNIHTRTDLIFF